MTEPFVQKTPEEVQPGWMRILPTLKDRIAAGVAARLAEEAKKTTD